jgi:hypothetical protein
VATCTHNETVESNTFTLTLKDSGEFDHSIAGDIPDQTRTALSDIYRPAEPRDCRAQVKNRVRQRRQRQPGRGQDFNGADVLRLESCICTMALREREP